MTHGSVRMCPIQSHSLSCGSISPSQIQRKSLVEKSLRSLLFLQNVVISRLFHSSIVARSILSATPKFVWLKSSEKFENEQEKTNHCSSWQCELWHIGSNHRLFDWPNVELMGHPLYSPDLAPKDLLLFRTSRNACRTIFVTKRYCCSVQKPCFGGVSDWKDKHKRWSYIKTFCVPLC